MIKKLFTKPGIYILLALGSFVSFWSCNKQNPGGITGNTNTITYVLANSTMTTIFYSAVQKAGLDTLFSSPAVFTLFVPNDMACTISGYSQSVINGFTSDQARKWVLYQTYAGGILPLQTFIGKTEEKLIMADGDSIFVTGDSNRTYVNGFQLPSSQAAAINGVIIALGNVLLPPTQNLNQMVAGDTSLSFFNEAIQLATPVPDSLSTLLTIGAPFSLFAPVNDAFRNVGFNSPSDLSAISPDSLRNFVLLTMVPQRLFTYDIPDSSSFKTAGDSTLVFYQTGLQTTVQVLGGDTTSLIISANQMAINGVLFKTDALLKNQLH
jgi:uncharacterized surface protein with fasciclin (FAS1) repeats